MTHTCRPGHKGVLADDCERCAEHAHEPMLLSLDQEKMADLWEVMVAVESDGTLACYATETDARAARQLYKMAIWLERYAGINRLCWRPPKEGAAV